MAEPEVHNLKYIIHFRFPVRYSMQYGKIGSAYPCREIILCNYFRFSYSMQHGEKRKVHILNI